jgi:hypothetical protein
MSGMRGLRVQSKGLGELLRPIGAFLDGCWWCLGGTGVSILRPAPGADASEETIQRWREEEEQAVAEYSLWVDKDFPNYQVGLPGFFSRYADCVDRDWVRYYASDAVEVPTNAFDEAGRLTVDWFAAPPALPTSICLFVRNIDNAYWDFFFRDDWAYEAVKGYLGERAREFVDVWEEAKKNQKKKKLRRGRK